MSGFTIDLKTNYWAMYPQQEVAFNSLIEKKGRDGSSKIMWGLALMNHPESDYFDMNRKDCETIVNKDWMNEKTDWKKYKKEEKLFKNITLDSKGRLLAFWKTKYNELTEFADDVKITEETFDLHLKILDKLPKLAASLDKALEDYNSNKGSAGTTKGDVEESYKEKIMG